LPSIRELYQQPLVPGWGLYLMVVGLFLLIFSTGIEMLCNWDS